MVAAPASNQNPKHKLKARVGRVGEREALNALSRKRPRRAVQTNKGVAAPPNMSGLPLLTTTHIFIYTVRYSVGFSRVRGS